MSVEAALLLAGALGLTAFGITLVRHQRRLQRAMADHAGLTERLAAEQAAAERERSRLARVVDAMLEGLLLVDDRGRVAIANPALRTLLGLPADVAGLPLADLVRHAELLRLVDEAAGTRAGLVRELEFGNLHPRRIVVHATPLPDGLLTLFVDVSEMRRLESHRKEFVANVSHELRTPIAAVRGAAENLQWAIANDTLTAAEFAALIERNAARLQHLVGDLLDLARIESPGFRPGLEAVGAAEALALVADPLRERAERRRMRVVVDAPAGLSVLADRRALDQVLANLADNAVQYAGDGATVELGARLAGDLVQGSSVELWVRDDGVGIAAEHLPRLFERFYRVDAGRSRASGGTGLGLAIVKHLVEAMGGTVGVQSEWGKGARFWVRLRGA